MRRLVLLGPPASGKGTQASLLSKHVGVPSISTGATLRTEMERKSEPGKVASSLLAKGELLPDDLMDDLVASWIERNGSGFILDGYPRTVSQAKALDHLMAEEALTIDCIVALSVPSAVLRQRVLSRLTCPGCEAVFQSGESHGGATVAEGSQCPKCRDGELVRRADDNAKTFDLRLDEYSRKTQAVSDYHRNLHRLREVDSDRHPDDVFAAILALCPDPCDDART